MSAVWFTDQVVALDSLGTDEGRAARAEGVTASEIHDIAVGSRATHQRILEAKLNGSTFHGNRHTRRGHEREPFLLAYAGELLGSVEPNTALFRHLDHPLHRCTPDGFAVTIEHGGIVGVEVKSHEHGHVLGDIPTDHADQMQWGMWVLGLQAWAYVSEVMGKDGTPTLDPPRLVWVARDDDRIARLAVEADRFIAWREAGAPPFDDLPADVDDALAVIAAEKRRAAAAAPEVKAADALVRRYAAEIEGAAEAGSKGAGTRASFVYAVTVGQELDEAAWETAEPDTYREWQDATAAAAATAEAAATLYHRPTRSTRFTIYPTKDAA